MKFRIRQEAPNKFIPQVKGILFWYSFGVDPDDLFGEKGGVFWYWSSDDLYCNELVFDTLEKAQKFIDDIAKSAVNTSKFTIHPYTPKL